MSFQLKKETETKENLVFQKIHEDIPGGVLLMAASLKAGTTEVPAGTVIGEDASSPKHWHVVKSVLLHADAANNATTYQVKKNHQLKVGEIISTKDVASTKGYAITAIDTSNAAYDVLTVGTTLGTAMTAADGVILIQIAAEDTSGGAGVPKYNTRFAITRDTVEVSASGNNIWVGAVTMGTLVESLLPYPVSADLKTRLGARFLFV